MLYPFVMQPYYKDYIWGGRNLEKYKKDLPEGKIAESWEVSVRPEGESSIVNGRWSGKKLKEVIGMFPEHMLGKAVKTGTDNMFPLLFKLIDANEPLSVQVHPGDSYAQSNEHEPFGKHEAWYILEAAQGASIVYGLSPGTDKERLAELIARNRIEDGLNTVFVRPGDVIDIPPGTVHALGKGIVAAEIQQNSNLTYRIYDYGRKDPSGKPRELHIEKALDVIDYSPSAPLISGTILCETDGSTITRMLRNMYFELDLLDIHGSLEMKAKDRFCLLFAVCSDACISYDCGELIVSPGETVFIPACLGEYAIAGNCRMLNMYVPADA
ncbi:MAG: type I phosphomannose isomerase catalytic subunit [Burkholderiales bacterium]